MYAGFSIATADNSIVRLSANCLTCRVAPEAAAAVVRQEVAEDLVNVHDLRVVLAPLRDKCNGDYGAVFSA